ncbi:MAG: hypothetical protein WCA56_17425 [Xanthobacteraceae bacterium]
MIRKAVLTHSIWVGIEQFLEDKLGIEVDITTRDGLHPMLRTAIEQSALRVF